jgi:hypothetical protein
MFQYKSQAPVALLGLASPGLPAFDGPSAVSPSGRSRRLRAKPAPAMDEGGSMMSFSTRHTRDTQAPQDYWQHAHGAINKSAKLIWFGLTGIVHGVLPEIKGLQFYTSTGILRAAKFLIDSRRHDAEIERIFGERFLRVSAGAKIPHWKQPNGSVAPE